MQMFGVNCKITTLKSRVLASVRRRVAKKIVAKRKGRQKVNKYRFDRDKLLIYDNEIYSNFRSVRGLKINMTEVCLNSKHNREVLV